MTCEILCKALLRGQKTLSRRYINAVILPLTLYFSFAELCICGLSGSLQFYPHKARVSDLLQCIWRRGQCLYCMIGCCTKQRVIIGLPLSPLCLQAERARSLGAIVYCVGVKEFNQTQVGLRQMRQNTDS